MRSDDAPIHRKRVTSQPQSNAALALELHSSQRARWPDEGRHILAQYDAESVVVYQAFREVIAAEAVALQRFGPSFSRSRMSWRARAHPCACSVQ
jgi:hypothetical protein